MRWKQAVHLVNVHCEGEIGRVAVGGLPKIPGSSIAEQLAWLNTDEGAGLRRLLCTEPRGGPVGSVNLLLPPRHPDADAAFVVLQPDQAHASSGSNSICVATALLETGMVEMREPETVVTLETAAGLVRARATCRDGRCEKVELTMVPSFVHLLDAEIETEEWGKVSFDIAFGGVFYALVDAPSLGLRIEPENARAVVDAGILLKERINRQMEIVHPEIPAISGVAYVMFRDLDEDGAIRTCTTMWPGRADRSPCGTGNSANLATLHARGKAAVGDMLKSRSIIGSQFEVGLKAVTEVAGRPAVVPTITGRAWTFGTQIVAIDPTDPFAEGFTLTDIWGPGVSQAG